jgi:2-polyprenyl-3-methyl-5-hydroxy-6-metoxy-1,4-benzoquinol methylase/predicted nuclease with TOPRIM domain
MPQTLEIDVDQLMEKIRASRGQSRLPGRSSPAPEAPPPDRQETADLAFLQAGHDVYHIDFTSHRKVMGRVVVAIKQALRQFMTPILERQCAFNAASARVAAHLQEQASRLQQQVSQLQEQAPHLREQATQLQEQAAQLQQQVSQLQEQAPHLREQATQLQQQVSQLQEQTPQVQEQASRLQQQVSRLQEQAPHLQEQATQLQQQVSRLQHQVEEVRQQQSTVLQTLRQDIEALGQQQGAALQALRAEFTDHVQTLRQQLKSGLAEGDVQRRGLEKQLTRWEKALSQRKVDYILQERRLTVLLQEARKRLPEPLGSEQLQVFADEGKHVLDALYVSFEDQFRGTREDIKERFRVYLPLLNEAKLGSDAMPILDIGCGRGEWLEVLREEGLRARGIDLNRVLVDECRSRGLEVVEGEAVRYLSTLPQSSFGAVTAFHLIEHLPFEAMITLLDETVRVLKPGGMAVFETPNPENVLVGSCNFYLDPTHRNPLPSSMVKFLAEARGLCRVEIINLHPYPDAYRVEEGGLEVAQQFNKYFYGPQDYAIVGWKV